MPIIPPKIIWNAKDHPDLSSGYGIVTRHLVPRLAAQYGRENVLIYAPVFNRGRVEEWQGIQVLPGLANEYEDPMLLEHYRNFDCNLMITVGDIPPLREIPVWARQDSILWIAWAPWDFLNLPDFALSILQCPVKLVPFSKYSERRFKEAGLENVEPAIWLGLDPDIWQPQDRKGLIGAMTSLGFSEESYNIVMVAANQDRKCIREALEGVMLFRQQCPKASPRLYLHTRAQGDRNVEMDLSDLGLGDITKIPEDYQMFLGGLPEDAMAAVFNCADVVLDVCMEGFGLTQSQAQACGVPVIYLDEGAGEELVQFGVQVPYYSVDRHTNLSKPLPNPAHIAEALGVLYESKTDRGEALRSYSASNWTRENLAWDRIAGQWFSVIDNTMELRWKNSMDIPGPSEGLLERARNQVELI